MQWLKTPKLTSKDTGVVAAYLKSANLSRDKRLKTSLLCYKKEM
jgi:hypothetical protein